MTQPSRAKTDEFLITGKRRLPAYQPSEANGWIRIREVRLVFRASSDKTTQFAVEHWRADGQFSTIGRFSELYAAQVTAWKAARARNALVTLSPGGRS